MSESKLRKALEACRLYLQIGDKFPKMKDCLRLAKITGTKDWSEAQMIAFINRVLSETNSADGGKGEKNDN